ncbi:MAG TPA: methyltransferase domain-containing protein [Elusimicrobiota bacterium]|nr:methyltransferase domain-containing protein [Elusimicrobiota bacterium]
MGLLRPLAIYYQTKMKLAKLRIHLLPRRGDRVLDVGSGDGPTPAADVLCDRFVGDDAERTAPLKLDRPFVSGDVQDLPFADGAFDFVYCSHLLEHTTDPARAIAELQRVAKAGYIEAPSEYLEKAAKSTAAHLWFVRQENRTLVFSPKPAGTLDTLVNVVFDELLMYKDDLYTAFHWSRFYDLFNIRFVWRGTIPHRIEGKARPADAFLKGKESLPSAERIARLREMFKAARAGDSAALSLAKGFLKKLIRLYYATGKKFDHLDLLACPVCKKPLQRSTELQRFTCVSCRTWYPWIEGVPCLIRAAAQDLA